MKRTNEQYEKEIIKQMKANNCSREEAIDIIKWDDAIDAGDKELGAITKEQQKLIRSLTKADKDPNKKTKHEIKERKVDDTKKLIMDALNTTLCSIDNLNITEVKNEAEIHFNVGESEFTLKLTKHRQKKS